MERRRRRAKHRRRRERRAALGELGQWDSSVHRWLEDRAGEFVLISIHDDATSRLMMACFVERDDGAENRRAIIAYLRRHGRPLAVYTDHAGHFGQWLAKKGRRTDTIISRALGELDIEVILAGSPQAKGRVERSFGTAQDRLVKEMRVAGITTIRAANRFLAEYWVPLWNERFAVEPRDASDAPRPLPPGADLEALYRRDGNAQGGPGLHYSLQESFLADSRAGGPGSRPRRRGRGGAPPPRRTALWARRPVHGARIPGPSPAIGRSGPPKDPQSGATETTQARSRPPVASPLCRERPASHRAQGAAPDTRNGRDQRKARRGGRWASARSASAVIGEIMTALSSSPSFSLPCGNESPSKTSVGSPVYGPGSPAPPTGEPRSPGRTFLLRSNPGHFYSCLTCQTGIEQSFPMRRQA